MIPLISIAFLKTRKRKKIHKELKETKKNSQFAITWNNIAIIKRILTGQVAMI